MRMLSSRWAVCVVVSAAHLVSTKYQQGKFTRYKGVMVLDDSGNLVVNVNGNVLPVSYNDPVVVAAGDAVSVDVVTGASGQSEAVVTGRLTLTPRPSTGTVTVVPVSSQTITVVGSDNVTYTANFASSYTPAVNDVVILAWNAAAPTVTAKVGTTAAPPPPPPPPAVVTAPVTAPPAPPQTGSTTYPATDSSSYATYGWDTYAGGGGNVYAGTAYDTVTGAWFYGGSPEALAGRTITRVRFTLANRRVAGAYNSVVNIVFSLHTSARRPSGNVTLTGSTYTLAVAPGWTTGTIDLPVAFGAGLLAGDGIALTTASNYAGFDGRLVNPASGKITLDWTR